MKNKLNALPIEEWGIETGLKKSLECHVDNAEPESFVRFALISFRDFLNSENIQIKQNLKKRNWISVKESFPSGETVLLCWESVETGKQKIDIMHISEYASKEYYTTGVRNLLDSEYFKITHWMPLPGLPEK